MGERTFKIPTSRITDFTKTIEKLSKRMVKLAGHPVTFEIVGEELFENAYAVTHMTVVKIHGADTPAVIDGWHFVAAMDKVDMPDGKSEVLVRTADTRPEVLERCINSRGQCEHCNKARKRNQWFLLERIETNAGI